MITVVNGYRDGWDTGYYIGRGGKGRKGSALANPYRLQNSHNDTERSQVIALYRKWLWQKIQVGDSEVMAELHLLKEQAITSDVRLLCFCKRPDKEVPCHGDVIKSCLEWLLDGLLDGKTSRSNCGKFD